MLRRLRLWRLDLRVGAARPAVAAIGLLALTGNHPDNTTLNHPCRLVFADGGRDITITGPLLEEEAAATHTGFWG
ncbi:hypothetical protein J2X60_002271 [Curtobacterium sp. 320]|nr:hypothetical protein [Curtobacterium sp. 320]